MRSGTTSVLAICVATVLFTLAMVPLVRGQDGNAEVARTRNQQYHELKPNNADVTRRRNLQCLELAPNNGDLTRYRNLQFFELAPNHADVIRFRNLQYLELAPNHGDIIRWRNLMYFELEPNDADIIRFRNLQHFLLEPLPYEYKIAVTSLLITDQNSYPTSDFLAGDIVQFDFVVENLGGSGDLPLYDGLVAVVILDPLDTVVSLSYTFVNLPRGAAEELFFGYWIPFDATAGTYTVKVTVYTDWPSEGGIGLAQETSTFHVG